jgi:putative transposase
MSPAKPPSRSSQPPSPSPQAPAVHVELSRAELVSAEALFRHQVVSQVLSCMLGGTSQVDCVHRVAGCLHPFAGSARQVAVRTLYRWLAAFRSGGVQALELEVRRRTETSEVLDERFLEFLRAEKKDDPCCSIPELIRRAREDRILGADESVDRVTVYRTCQRMGLPLGQRSTKKDRDARRFAHPHRLMMVLSDGKHFRAGAARLRRVALFFLDDATRRGLHAVVGTSESTELFLRGLYELVLRVGLMDIVYLDRGPGFRSDDTHRAVQRLGAHWVLGTAGYPEGHGKIEKFHQTAWRGVLRGLRRPEVDPDPRSLELRLQHFLTEQYNHWPHESLSGDSPQERWDADTRPLRFPKDTASLRERFVVTETRKVSFDHVLSWGGLGDDLGPFIAGDTENPSRSGTWAPGPDCDRD